MAVHDFQTVLSEQHTLLNQLIVDSRAFQELPLELLRQQPAPGKWSVLQCYEHMTITNAHYLQQLEPALKRDFPQANGKLSYRSTLFGNFMVNGMLPKSNGRIPLPMPTFKKFAAQPSENLDKGIIELFVQQQQRLLALLNPAGQADLGAIKITSAIAVLRFKLGDAFRFVTAHNLRHVQQAKNALNLLADTKAARGQ